MCGLLSGPLNRNCADHQRHRCPKELLRPKWRNENAMGWRHEDHVGARSEERIRPDDRHRSRGAGAHRKHGRGVVVVVAVEEYERLTVRLDSHGKTVRQAMEAPRK